MTDTFKYAPTPIHQRLDRAAWILAVVAALLLALPDATGALWGVLAAVCAWILLIVSFRQRPPDVAIITQDADSSPDRTRTRAHWIAAAVGVGLLAILGEINGQRLNLAIMDNIGILVQVSLLLAGVGLIIWGLGGGPARQEWHRPHLDRRETLMVGGVVLFALLLRFVGLDSLRVLVDELQAVSEINALHIDGQRMTLTPITRSISPYPWMFPLMRYAGVTIFGYNLVGLRVASAVVGALTVGVTYGLARTCFDRRIAITAAFLLAVLPPHVHFSRLAPINIMDGLVGPLALWLILRALKSNRRMDFVLAGAAFGFSQYFFDGAKLFFPLLTLLMLMMSALFWRDWLRGRGRSLLLTAFTALLVAFPLWYTYTAIDMPLFGRLAESGQGRDYWLNLLLSPASGQTFRLLVDDLARAFLVYASLPEETLFYAGNTALILPWVVPLVIVGIGVVVWHWRTPLVVFLLWIIATPLATGLFLYVGTSSIHYIGTFPALAILMALGLNHLTGTFALNRRWLRPGLLAILAITQLVYYFGPHLDTFASQIVDERTHLDVDDAALRSVNFPDQTRVFMISGFDYYWEHPNMFLRFLNAGEKQVPIVTIGKPDLPDQLDYIPPGHNLAFFLDPADTDNLELLKGLYDLQGPIYSPYYPSPDTPGQFVLYLYSPGDDSWIDDVVGSINKSGQD